MPFSIRKSLVIEISSESGIFCRYSSISGNKNSTTFSSNLLSIQNLLTACAHILSSMKDGTHKGSSVSSWAAFPATHTQSPPQSFTRSQIERLHRSFFAIVLPMIPSAIRFRVTILAVMLKAHPFPVVLSITIMLPPAFILRCF